MKPDAEGECSVRIGPAGWSYDDWKGIVYPPRMPHALHPVQFLAQYFDTIEINSTFYRPPNAKHCASWCGKLEGYPRFRFTAKLWERFTHHREGWPSEAEVKLVKEGFRPLVESGRLGVLLAQFPWSFRRTEANRAWLGRIAETFTETRLAVELRHSSWDLEEVCASFRARNMAFCEIDQPLYEDSIAPCGRVTTDLGYIRMHGRNYRNWFRENIAPHERYDYLYSEEELAPWIDRVKAMRKQVRELYIVTNNHFQGQAVVNAIELAAGLNEGKGAALPESLVEAYPRLRTIGGVARA